MPTRHSSYLRIILTILALTGLVFLNACDGNTSKLNKGLTGFAPAIEGKLKLTGSSTMAPLMTAIAQRFQSLHPKVSIKVEMGGSGRGISDARSGKADIGMASLVMTDKENDLIGFPIARDGIGVLVNQSNSLVNLSERELLAIFTGEVRNWEKVGGPEGPITVIDRDEGRGSTALFTHHFKIKHADIRAQKVIGDNNEAITTVATEAQAVTLMSIVAAENSISGGTKIKLLSLNGVPANSRNIITGSYPLARPLTLVTKGLPDGVAKDFIEFALSSQTIDIIREIGFVPYQE